MSETTMRSAIEARLQTQMDNRLPKTLLRFDDVSATQPANEPYVTFTILEGDGRRANLGGKRTTRHVGVLQIDCMYPKGSGLGPVSRLATFAGSLFDEWVASLPDNATVNFRVPKQADLGEQGEFRRMAVSIPYWRDERSK